MKKYIKAVLPIIIGSAVGVFIGRAVFLYTDFKSHPELYIANSAPWYTALFMPAVFTLCVIIICSVLKFLLRKNKK